MVFFLFFLALDLLSRQLRDVLNERKLKIYIFLEKTASKLKIRVSSPTFAVRNSHNYGPQFLSFFFRMNQRAFAVRNFCMRVLLTWFLRVNPTHLVPSTISHVEFLFPSNNLQNNKKCSSISNSTQKLNKFLTIDIKCIVFEIKP
jgi:hypothetical protein